MRLPRIHSATARVEKEHRRLPRLAPRLPLAVPIPLAKGAPGETREVFRDALSVDDATWARGRGWALSVGLIALPYYRITNPVLAGVARRALDEVLADHRRGA